MKENDEQIEKRLEGLGDLLRAQPSITKKGMQTLRQIQNAGPIRRTVFGLPLVRSGLSAAACFLVAVCVWFVILGTADFTLADVQQSITAKTWVLIRYQDGAREWANLQERISFYTRKDSDGGNFYVGMRDHVKGIWRYYHSNHGEQIHEAPFTPRPYPQMPWEYAVGDWDNRGIDKFARKTVEKFSDNIDGRQVVRFDTYNIGPLGLRSLAQQVWADPETR